jgi:hypothetical protein
MVNRKLGLICVLALAFRLFLLPLIHHPGIADSNHYYNLGKRLAEGHGYTIDYIWQYNNPPDNMVHPDDYWMPLNGLIVGAAMRVFGTSVTAALIPFILLGSLIPIIGYYAARQFDCSENASLFAAAVVAFLPEFVLNSLRTDTTIPNIVFVCGSILLLTRGLRRGGIMPFIGSGILAGLAHQQRSDSALLLPMLAVTLIVYVLWGRQFAVKTARWRYVVLIPIIAIAIAVPWALRNLELAGTISTPKLDSMFYLTDYLDHYVYSRELSLQTLLASQTVSQLIGKRLFEMAATIKLMYTTLGMFLPVAVVGGGVLLIRGRDRDRLMTLAPTLILLGGFFFFYTVLVPFKSQGGSMKKAYLSLIPLLIPIAAYALERALVDTRIRNMTMILVVGFLALNAFDLVRSDARFTNNYLNTMRGIVSDIQSLPDTNGDGEITLMAQDPFMLRFLGIRSALIPSDTREAVLEVAQRYGLDYMLMPPDRPTLDPIYNQTDFDPRFVPVLDIPGTAMSLYGFNFDVD